MTSNEFWQIIDLARNATRSTEQVPAWLTSYLCKQPVPSIIEFERELQRCFCLSYDARVWAAATLMMGLCSDDKFTDFRGWLIAQGRSQYEAAIDNPDSLADVNHIDGDCGRPLLFGMLYAPTRAYRRMSGDDLADIPIDYSKPHLLNKNLWAGDVSKLRMLLPKLYAKYAKK